MWIVKLVTFIEYHPLLTLGMLLAVLGPIWLVRREQKRLSYRQRDDLEHLLSGLKPSRGLSEDTEEER